MPGQETLISNTSNKIIAAKEASALLFQTLSHSPAQRQVIKWGLRTAELLNEAKERARHPHLPTDVGEKLRLFFTSKLPKILKKDILPNKAASTTAPPARVAPTSAQAPGNLREIARDTESLEGTKENEKLAACLPGQNVSADDVVEIGQACNQVLYGAQADQELKIKLPGGEEAVLSNSLPSNWQIKTVENGYDVVLSAERNFDELPTTNGGVFEFSNRSIMKQEITVQLRRDPEGNLQVENVDRWFDVKAWSMAGDPLTPSAASERARN